MSEFRKFQGKDKSAILIKNTISQCALTSLYVRPLHSALARLSSILSMYRFVSIYLSIWFILLSVLPTYFIDKSISFSISLSFFRVYIFFLLNLISFLHLVNTGIFISFCHFNTNTLPFPLHCHGARACLSICCSLIPFLAYIWEHPRFAICYFIFTLSSIIWSY